MEITMQEEKTNIIKRNDVFRRIVNDIRELIPLRVLARLFLVAYLGTTMVFSIIGFIADQNEEPSVSRTYQMPAWPSGKKAEIERSNEISSSEIESKPALPCTFCSASAETQPVEEESRSSHWGTVFVVMFLLLLIELIVNAVANGLAEIVAWVRFRCRPHAADSGSEILL